MQSVNLNSGSKAQTPLSFTKHSKTASVSIQDNSKKDTVSFTGKKETEGAGKDNSSVLKKVVAAVIAAAAALIKAIAGNKTTQVEKSGTSKEKAPAKPAVKSDSTGGKASAQATIESDTVKEKAPVQQAVAAEVEGKPKADVVEPEEVVETEAAAEVAAAGAVEEAEVVDETQKEILKLVNGAEKEVQELADTVQAEAKEIHADALGRIAELVKVTDNDGKDSEGKRVGEMKYHLDKNACSLILKKDKDDVISDCITVEIGTGKVLGAHIRFEDGMLINVNSDVMDCTVDGDKRHYFFDRKKDDELKAYMGDVHDDRTVIMLDYRDGEVAEYSEMSMRHTYPVIYPRHAIFRHGEMVGYYENSYFEDKTMEFEKGYSKTFGGTWRDLAKEK